MEMIGTPHITPANGTTIAWSEAGDVTARPLILLHGLGDSHRTWRRVAPILAERYRVLMPDLPGHGLSGRPDATYTLDWYAPKYLSRHTFAEVAEWFREAGLTNVADVAKVRAFYPAGPGNGNDVSGTRP